jgi:hypothetical protein
MIKIFRLLVMMVVVDAAEYFRLDGELVVVLYIPCFFIKITRTILENTTDDKDIIFKSDDGSGGVTTYFACQGSGVETYL